MNTKKHETILVIDDEKELLMMVKRIVELDGYHVYIAADGETGLKVMEECKPDLILLDIMMPGLDGFQTLKLIRERSEVPVIMLTAKNDKSTMRDALEIGADDYMTKPFGMKELLARIKAKTRRANMRTMKEG